jgi:hypothetical protein
MKKMLYIIIIISLGLANFLNAQAQVEMYVQKQGNSYNIMWIPNQWDANWEGFVLKYSVPGSNAWTIWNEQAIRPEITANRNFTAQGLTGLDITRINGKYEIVGEQHSLEFRNLTNIINESENGFPAGDVIRMHKDFDYALFLGLGAVAQLSNSVIYYEWGLFPLLTSNEIASTPVTTSSSTNFIQPLISSLEHGAERVSRAIHVEWSVDELPYKQAGIYGFNFYETNNGNVTQLAENVGPYKKENGKLYFRYTYSTERFDMPRTFRIAPNTIFDEELQQIQILYNGESATPEIIQLIELIDADPAGGPRINLRYQLVPPNTQHLIVERYNNVSGEFEIIQSNLLPETEFWVDAGELEFGTRYLYRVGMVSQDRILYSNVETILFFGSPAPPPVQGVTARFIMENNQPFVELAWLPLLHARPKILGYQLNLNDNAENEMRQLSNVPIIQGNRYKYPIRHSGNRQVTFQVVAVNEMGTTSLEGGEVIVEIPSLRTNPPANFKAFLNNNNQIELTWDFNNNTNISGFRITANNQPVAGLAQLQAAARTYLLRNPQPDNKGNILFELYAVGEYSESLAAKTHLSVPTKISQGAMSTIQNLSVQQVQEGGDTYAQFSWTGSISDYNSPGFVIYADLRTSGNPERMGSLPLIKESPYNFKLPEPVRAEYHFKLVPLDMNYKEMLGTQIKLNIQ